MCNDVLYIPAMKLKTIMRNFGLIPPSRNFGGELRASRQTFSVEGNAQESERVEGEAARTDKVTEKERRRKEERHKERGTVFMLQFTRGVNVLCAQDSMFNCSTWYILSKSVLYACKSYSNLQRSFAGAPRSASPRACWAPRSRSRPPCTDW